MKLIPNFKQAHKMWSMQIAAVLTVIQIPPLLFPEILVALKDNFAQIAQYIPEQFHDTVLLVLTVGIIVSRVVDQDNVDG